MLFFSCITGLVHICIETNYKYKVVLDSFIWSFGNLQVKETKISIIIVRNLKTHKIYTSLSQYLNKYHVKSSVLVLAVDSHLPEYFSLPSRNKFLTIKEILLDNVKDVSFDTDLILEIMGRSIQQEGFSDGYRSAYIKGVKYKFSKKQAEVLELLHKTGKPMHQDEIMAIISPNSNYTRLALVFRVKEGIHPAFGTIIKTDGKGYYWLDY